MVADRESERLGDLREQQRLAGTMGTYQEQRLLDRERGKQQRCDRGAPRPLKRKVIPFGLLHRIRLYDN